MELTQEYFNEKLSSLATRNDLTQAIEPLATKQHVTDSVDALARIISTTIAEPMQKHFDELHGEFDVKQEVQELKRDMLKLNLHCI